VGGAADIETEPKGDGRCGGLERGNASTERRRTKIEKLMPGGGGGGGGGPANKNRASVIGVRGGGGGVKRESKYMQSWYDL